MDNLLNILSLLNSSNQKNITDEKKEQKIPQEILDQYPYGKFPSRYTKSGQEDLRRISESRFSQEPEHQLEESKKEDSNIDFSSILPIIQLLSGKQQPKDMMKILSKMLFKDNKDMEKLFELITPSNKQNAKEIKNTTAFPDTNKVKISSLRRIDE